VKHRLRCRANIYKNALFKQIKENQSKSRTHQETQTTLSVIAEW